MIQPNNYDSSNINTLWLNNIYENLKNLEQLMRLSREGCTSLFEYMKIPVEQRKILIADTQYKNLRFMITELDLLLTDITPTIGEDKVEEFRKLLQPVEDIIDNRFLFVKETTSVTKNGITSSALLPFFYDTLNFVSKMRNNIIKSISHLLYIKDDDKIRNTSKGTVLT